MYIYLSNKSPSPAFTFSFSLSLSLSLSFAFFLCCSLLVVSIFTQTVSLCIYSSLDLSLSSLALFHSLLLPLSLFLSRYFIFSFFLAFSHSVFLWFLLPFFHALSLVLLGALAWSFSPSLFPYLSFSQSREKLSRCLNFCLPRAVCRLV